MSSDAPKDGGPAFPQVNETSGMSLRDWFAGQAIAGGLARATGVPEYELRGMFGDHATGIRREQIIAADAYRIADALLASREAKP